MTRLCSARSTAPLIEGSGSPMQAISGARAASDCMGAKSGRQLSSASTCAADLRSSGLAARDGASNEAIVRVLASVTIVGALHHGNQSHGRRARRWQPDMYENKSWCAVADSHRKRIFTISHLMSYHSQCCPAE